MHLNLYPQILARFAAWLNWNDGRVNKYSAMIMQPRMSNELPQWPKWPLFALVFPFRLSNPLPVPNWRKVAQLLIND